MKLSKLPRSPGKQKRKRRLGRGPGSGSGKTSGKGHKGMLARAGRANTVGFEGGQMPLARRLPKRGFHNIHRVEYCIVNLGTLSGFTDLDEITHKILLERRIVRKAGRPVKILGNGDLDRPLVIEAHSFSKSALQKIQQAGGQAKVIGRA